QGRLLCHLEEQQGAVTVSLDIDNASPVAIRVEDDPRLSETVPFFRHDPADERGYETGNIDVRVADQRQWCVVSAERAQYDARRAHRAGGENETTGSESSGGSGAGIMGQHPPVAGCRAFAK